MAILDYSKRIAPKRGADKAEDECHVVFDYDVPDGLNDQQYTIRSTEDLDVLSESIKRFITFAENNPSTKFLVVCGYPTKYSAKELAPFFWSSIPVENIHLPEFYWKILTSDDYSRKHPIKVSYELLSNLIRFGYGTAENEGKKIYFALHGCPNRNDDYYTLTEITEQELTRLRDKYKHGSWGHEVGDLFREEFIEKHKVYYEGTYFPDILWV